VSIIAQGRFNWAARIGQEIGDTCQRLVGFGIEYDGADQRIGNFGTGNRKHEAGGVPDTVGGK
jgi:hypothetical protein